MQLIQLKDLKSKIDESKEAFRQEVATLNAQVRFFYFCE